MRKLTRPRVSLPTLVGIRAMYPLNRTGVAEYPLGHWNNPDVRGALYAMHGRVCAYCGSPASDQRGDVEHYRPKSVYPWLTYEFRNYLLGCRVCNSSRKSTEFPLFLSAKPLRYDPRMSQEPDFLEKALAREKRLLLDPAADPVDDWLDIDYENDLCAVRASAIASKDRAVRESVEQTIEFFGLNTIVELVRNRNQQVTAAIGALREWSEGNLARGEDVRVLSNRYTAHGWAVRRVAGLLAPSLALPTAEEDLKCLVDETLGLLDIADAILKKRIPDKDRKQVVNRREESCWTVAILWKDPPAASSVEVGKWIDAHGRRSVIQPFLDRL
jgi:hypothetical protein